MRAAVSVIVPVFNGGRCILRCIKSIQSQTLGNIEIIIVNDGSTDETAAVLESVIDSRIRVINQENAGQGFARNAGIDAAGGEYVSFVDADDTIEKNMLEVMYNRAKADKADMVQCNILNINPDGSERVQLPALDGIVEITDSGEYSDKYFAVCRHSFEVCNKLIDLDFLRESGVRFCDTRRCFSEDLMFNLELLTHIRKISFISEPYYNYYRNETSHFHSGADKRLRGVCNLFEDYMRKAPQSMRYPASYTAAMVILYTAGLCGRGDGLALDVIASDTMRRYIRAALTRRCRLKHRLFLSAVGILPPSVGLMMAEKYSKR